MKRSETVQVLCFASDRQGSDIRVIPNQIGCTHLYKLQCPFPLYRCGLLRTLKYNMPGGRSSSFSKCVLRYNTEGEEKKKKESR